MQQLSNKQKAFRAGMASAVNRRPGLIGPKSAGKINPKVPSTWGTDLQEAYMNEFYKHLYFDPGGDLKEGKMYSAISVTNDGRIMYGGFSDTPYKIKVDKATGIPLITE